MILSYDPAALSPSTTLSAAPERFTCDGDTIGIPNSLANPLASV
jgi:hypothetical protein